MPRSQPLVEDSLVPRRGLETRLCEGWSTRAWEELGLKKTPSCAQTTFRWGVKMWSGNEATGDGAVLPSVVL